MSFAKVCILVNIDVAIAIKVFNQGYGRFLGEALNQPFATSGDNDVNIVSHGHKGTNGITIDGGHNLHSIGGQPGCLEPFLNDSAPRLDGMKCIAPTA